ncbi:MAG: fucose isomerase [Caldilinea sp. CFX5]|nr:fucose isomerase [Caldilinea sp. CFX5]
MLPNQRKFVVALVAIARPTFDVPFAQMMSDVALQQLTIAGYTVVGPGRTLLMDSTATTQAIEQLAATHFDLLILLQASFADSSMAVQLAEALQAKGAPLLLWATPDARSGGRLRLNSLCGINLAGHALHLRGIPYDYLLAQPTDVTVLPKIAQLARVGYARRQLATARVGLVGEHPVGFDTCIYDADHLAEIFGLQVTPLPLPATLQRAAQVDAETRRTFVARVGEHAHNLADLDQTALAGTAGVYGALRSLVEEQKLQGVAVRCWPEFFTELGCAACGAMSMLNEEQCPASCEADVNGTVTSLLLQALSGEPAFITDLVSIDAESDTGVLWHCGLAPVSMADPEAPILGTIHSNRKLPLLFEFPLKPGRVTIARLHRTAQPVTGAIQNYQLVIGGGEMVRAPKSFSGTSGVVRFDQPATAVFDTVMRQGLEHHFCITYGDYRAELRTFAGLVGLPILELT